MWDAVHKTESLHITATVMRTKRFLLYKGSLVASGVRRPIKSGFLKMCYANMDIVRQNHRIKEKKCPSVNAVNRKIN
jgi:hypothetical protein